MDSPHNLLGVGEILRDVNSDVHSSPQFQIAWEL